MDWSLVKAALDLVKVGKQVAVAGGLCEVCLLHHSGIGPMSCENCEVTLCSYCELKMCERARDAQSKTLVCLKCGGTYLRL
jgi:hypothetical protein